ncbi:MAG: phosphonopyruvate decarboxylase [Acidimicrobiia bacterium]
MLSPEIAYDAFSDAGVSFWTGVPDSLLKELNSFVVDAAGKGSHVVAANEGGAIALAAGHYLASGQPAAVYLQNSGLGNTINPLLSLADNAVYGIPMVLVIGWRGEPGAKDEPQHVKQGAVTLQVLEAAGVPFVVLDQDAATAVSQITETVTSSLEAQQPRAIVVRSGTFAPHQSRGAESSSLPLSREEAVVTVAEAIAEESVVVSTTGKTSRELYEYRVMSGSDGAQDFLTVGGMGHASQIALGIDLASDRDVWVLDGDGAVLMHMGSLPVIGQYASARFKHVVFNNGVHDSVGGQPTPLETASIPEIAKSSGYRSVQSVTTRDELTAALADLKTTTGPALLEVMVRPGARADLGRPATTPDENKRSLMTHLSDN